MHPIVNSYLAQLASAAPILREGARTKPVVNNAGEAVPALYKAMEQRMKDIDAADIPELKLVKTVPPDLKDAFKSKENVAQFAKALNPTHGFLYAKNPDGSLDMNRYVGDQITYNPNADRALLAHEMGHAVSAKSKAGSVIRNLRNNPKLAMAIAAATGAVPLGAAVLTPGDDDYNTAIAGTLALAAPTLIDEGLATKNALAMLDTAGMRASLGQRGKLAGGLLSYVAAPMATAATATAIGNQFDENVPQY